MRSILCGYLYLPTHNELITAHYKFPLEDSEPNSIALPSDADLNTFVRTEDHGIFKKVIPHLCITILDPSTERSRASYVVGDSQDLVCRNVFFNDAAGGVTASGEDIFGDAEILESGFPRLEDGSEKTITIECLAIIH